MLTSGNAGVVDVSFVFAGVVCIISEPALLRCFDTMNKNINYDPTHLKQTLCKMLKNAYLFPGWKFRWQFRIRASLKVGVLK